MLSYLSHMFSSRLALLGASNVLSSPSSGKLLEKLCRPNRPFYPLKKPKLELEEDQSTEEEEEEEIFQSAKTVFLRH